MKYAITSAGILVAALLTGGCGDNTSVRFCTGSASFCASFNNANRSPRADAGPDQSVIAGDLVRLDGTASNDPDGDIDSYSWVQTAGTPVALVNADRALATFVAPEVDNLEVLRFQLTVVDEGRRSDSDDTAVTVEPSPVSPVAAGFQLLEKHVYPDSVDGGQQCPNSVVQAQERSAFVGLWLVARVADVRARDNPVATAELLDALRRLTPIMPAAIAGPSASAVLKLGLGEALGFTQERDPAVAAAIEAPLQDLGEVPVPGWVTNGEFQLRRRADGSRELDVADRREAERGAERLLTDVRCTAGVDPLTIAAATALLVCQRRPDGCWPARGAGGPARGAGGPARGVGGR